MDFGPLIKAERLRRNMSQGTLAKQIGISQTAIQKIEDGLTTKSRYLSEIIEFLELNPKNQTQSQGEFRPPPKLFDPAAPAMPVYSAAEGGEGFIVISSDVIEYLPRPYTLEGIPEAYGILVVGESMTPAFKPGETAWVNPRLPPSRDADVILYEIGDETGEARALIKELVSWTADHWTVKQFNPAKTFKLERASWNRCHVVVGKFMRR